MSIRRCFCSVHTAILRTGPLQFDVLSRWKVQQYPRGRTEKKVEEKILLTLRGGHRGLYPEHENVPELNKFSCGCFHHLSGLGNFKLWIYIKMISD